MALTALFVMLMHGGVAMAQVVPLELSGATLRGSNRSGGTFGNTTSQTSTDPWGNDTSSTVDTSMKGLVDHVEPPDSVLQGKVFMFHYNPLDVKIMAYSHPSLSPTGAQFAERLDALNGDYYLSKGTIGHQHLPLWFNRGQSLSLQPMPALFKGLLRSPTTVDFFITQTPYTCLGYSSSLNNDYQVMVAHSQNVLPRLNVAFNYNLLSPEGLYSASGATDHLLDFTANYYSPSARYQVQGGVLWQHLKVDESGGLAADSIFTMRLQTNRAGVPVRLADVQSSVKSLQLFVHQSYNTVRELDNYVERTEVVVIDSVADSVTVTDTIAAPAPKVFNTGVFGLDLMAQSDTLYFGSAQLWQHTEALLYWTNDAYMNYRYRNRLKLTAGLKPEHFRLAGDSVETIDFASLSPFARLVASLTSRLTATVKAEQRWATMSGMNATRVEAGARYGLDSLTHLQLRLWHQSAPAELLYHRSVPQGQTALNVLNVSAVQLSAMRQGLFSIEGTARKVAGNVWMDSTGCAHQAQGSAWLLQGKLALTLAWGPMRLDMQQIIQHSTDPEQIRVPLWASKNSLYADLTLLHGIVRAQIGADARYHTPYRADAYQPIGGYFYRQDEVEVGGYLWADVFLNLQIKRATIYVKAGHVNALWDTSPNYFLLPHYPGNDFGLAYGLTWKFFD